MMSARAALFAALILRAWTFPAQAATFTLTSFADGSDAAPGNTVCGTVSGGCTLRAAIEETNALANAASNPDVINVPAGEYLLSGGVLLITDDLRIVGSREAPSIVNGQHLDGVFTVDGGRARPTVELHRLTIRNGRAPFAGGGILNQHGRVLVNSCVVQSSDAFSAGGGIYNEAGSVLELVRSSVSSNGRNLGGDIEPQRGGGIYNAGGMLIDKSTVSSNQAGRGGGIYNPAGELMMRNSTVSGNLSLIDTGGMLLGGGAVAMNNVTVAMNEGYPEYHQAFEPHPSAAGGISGPAQIRMANTIVALNTFGPPGAFPDRQDCSTAIDSLGYNLVYDTAGCTLMGDLTGNITGLDPFLMPLSPNGGPTATHAITARSAAVNAGNPNPPNGLGYACESTDQRARARGAGPGVGRCDIGAYERSAAPGGEAAGRP
jgi:CSLREA domain-containing protein